MANSRLARERAAIPSLTFHAWSSSSIATSSSPTYQTPRVCRCLSFEHPNARPESTLGTHLRLDLLEFGNPRQVLRLTPHALIEGVLAADARRGIVCLRPTPAGGGGRAASGPSAIYRRAGAPRSIGRNSDTSEGSGLLEYRCGARSNLPSGDCSDG